MSVVTVRAEEKQAAVPGHLCTGGDALTSATEGRGCDLGDTASSQKNRIFREVARQRKVTSKAANVGRPT